MTVTLRVEVAHRAAAVAAVGRIRTAQVVHPAQVRHRLDRLVGLVVSDGMRVAVVVQVGTVTVTKAGAVHARGGQNK